MPFTEADLLAVRGAIATGARTVEFRDRRVTYHSISELMQVEAHIQNSLNASAGTGRPKQTVIIGEKGL